MTTLGMEEKSLEGDARSGPQPFTADGTAGNCTNPPAGGPCARWSRARGPLQRTGETARGAPMIHLAHFSDVHIPAKPLGWQREDWFNKRLPGWINFAWLGRQHRFRRAEDVLAVLVAELRQRRAGRGIFSRAAPG